MSDRPPAPVQAAKTPVLHAVLANYVPALGLLYGLYGMARPIFDHTASFDPIFWYVGGASLLTIYGRLATRDVEGDADDDESFDEKYRFSLPAFLRKGHR